MKLRKIIDKVKNKACRTYIKTYYYKNYFNLGIKINKILKFDKKSIFLNEEEQEEQALPGFNKYKKNGYYKYMLGRYLFSLNYIHNKTVLDSGCGFGWGSYLISTYPKRIISIDRDEKSIIFAKKVWKDDRLNFKVHSILELEKMKEIFDVVLSYEVIEHLSIKDGKKYIDQISKVLSNNGVLIMSSYFPNNDYEARKEELKNEYHLHIFTKDEIRKILLITKFNKVRFLGDLMLVASK